MSEHIETLGDIEADINLQWRRVQESRADNHPVLDKLFQKRMNEALDRWSDFQAFAGQVALATGEN